MVITLVKTPFVHDHNLDSYICTKPIQYTEMFNFNNIQTLK